LALYQSRAPINHVDALGCPVIFFQGLDDKVVPPNQAQLMVSALKARGLPVAHYEFAGEGHGFRQQQTLRRVLELELSFYGQVFGFTPAGSIEAAEIAGR
jgi:dipeptidyl aminopeptidase/acylaminoacyl peptidase